MIKKGMIMDEKGKGVGSLRIAVASDL